MSYQSFLVTQDDLDSYYDPKSQIYSLMNESIGYNGYGQAIYNFVSSDDNTINSVNIWNSSNRSMMIYVISTDTWYTESQAGPSLWGVTSQQGIDFLNGNYDIDGLAKLKYCNKCSDGNGLPVPVITSFKERTQYLKELMVSYGTSESYLFYDYAQPVRQNFFPAVMDPNIGNYIFKNYQGTTKSEIQVAADTRIPREDISVSLSEAEPIRPRPSTLLYVIRWCCGLNTEIIEVNSSLELRSVINFTDDERRYSSPCFTVLSRSEDRPTITGSVNSTYGDCNTCWTDTRTRC